MAAARLFFRRLERSQNRLTESEKRFRELAEVSGDWFFEMDSELRLSFISDRFFEITGLKPDDVIGRTRQQIAANTGVQGAFAQHVADLEARREFRRFEYEISGGPKPVHVSISGVPVFDDQGAFVGYRGTGTDVSDLKEKERQLAEANRNFGDSVTYASSIQRGLLPSTEGLTGHLGRTRSSGSRRIWSAVISTGRGGLAMSIIWYFSTAPVTAPRRIHDADRHFGSGGDRRFLADGAAGGADHDGVCRQLGIEVDSPGMTGLTARWCGLTEARTLWNSPAPRSTCSKSPMMAR